MRRLLRRLLRRRIIAQAAVLDPPLPASHWQDRWTRTAEANGFTRVRQGTNRGDPT